MDTKNKQEDNWKETIHYIKDIHDDGRTSYTGQSINYGVVGSSWKSVEDLKIKMKGLIEIWLDLGNKTMEKEDCFIMKECTYEEWESKEDNIDYYELERMKRIMKRPSVQEVWKKIIKEALINEVWEWVHSSDHAAKIIIEKFINSETE